MPFIQIHVHAVWGTKNRYPFLTAELLMQLCDHMAENARSKNIYVQEINGSADHLHVLFSLNKELSLAKHIQLLKGESSFWINQNRFTASKFEWADEYFAASVSESRLKYAEQYIKNQQEHHRRISFEDEYRSFLSEYNVNGAKAPL